MDTVITTLTEPFQYEFFNKALLASVLIGGLCGLIGVYVVLRRMSYIGHGLSHSIFGGAVVSYVLQWNFYLGAGLWGFLSALIIDAIARKRKVATDAAIGIVTTASFALGVAIISKSRSFTKNFEAALFGNILGIRDSDLVVIALVAGAVGLVIFFIYKQLLFSTFDPEVAPSYGVSTRWIDTFFALALAGTIIVSMQILGVTLIAASLIIPPIVARLLTDNFHHMVLYSILIGVFASTTGLYLSYLLDVASGASIVLTASLLFVLVLAFGVIKKRVFNIKSPLTPAKVSVAGQATDGAVAVTSGSPVGGATRKGHPEDHLH
jgi:ABC-type Mn2+/Zn2+ transport system permease subunit